MTETKLIEQEFIFNNKAKEIYPFLVEVTAFMQYHLKDHENLGRMVSSSKLIITELLTNAIKHAGKSDVVLRIGFGDRHLYIRKIDNGNPFYLNEYEGREALTWPVNHRTNGTLKVYSDELNGLFAKMLNEHQLRFYTEDYTTEENSLFTDIAEHFGLMIICKLSEEFTYTYNHETNTNYFEAVLNL